MVENIYSYRYRCAFESLANGTWRTEIEVAYQGSIDE